MGFIVSQSVEDRSGNYYDSFYVRIEGYQLNKVQGYIGTSVSHYESKEAAKSNIPDYIDYSTEPFGRINVSMSYNDEWKEWPMWYKFPLTQSVIVTETHYSSSWHPETINYVDFDEEGNEITGSREEWIETVYSSSVEVPRILKN
jgi:hypothetical protein